MAAAPIGLRVMVHVGHNSLADSRALAAHAASIGADSFACMSPFFFMSELPVGVAGLLVTGIFAAAQSKLSGSMNLFVLGIFSRRASGRGALAGALGSAVIVFSIRHTQPLSVYAYAPIGLAACVGIGWVISLAYPAGPRNLDGLTIYSIRRQQA